MKQGTLSLLYLYICTEHEVGLWACVERRPMQTASLEPVQSSGIVAVEGPRHKKGKLRRNSGATVAPG